MYRIRAGTATFQSYKQSADGVVGMLLTHPANVWKPAGLFDYRARGGTIKAARASGWSTSLVDAGQDWNDLSAAGASLYVGTSEAANVVGAGAVTLTLTVQFRGLV